GHPMRHGRSKCNFADRVCSHRTYTATTVETPPVPVVLGDIPYNPCGKPWSDFSDLE
ncbi:Hypothetical predicted protein, partial [Marmota monax]